MSVLYRKYRPQTFAEVVGQPHVTQTLAAAVALGRVAHAYLFSGPRGVGKTTAARLLAKAVNCERRTKELKDGEQPRRTGGSSKVLRSSVLRSSVQPEVPCNTCDRCTEITEGRCLDVIEIDAASNTQVEKVREGIIETVRIAPAVATRKVFIIDEVHMLSQASFNALLKTIEEPPAHVLFILATTELHKVPETIRSRCQQFMFRRVALADLVQRLEGLAAAEKVTVDADVVQAIARTADGSVRDAESVFGQLLAFGGKRIAAADATFVLPRSSVERARALADAIARGDGRAALEEVRLAEEGGFDADAYLRDVITVLRDAILQCFSPSSRGGARGGGSEEHVGVGTSEIFAREVAALRAFSDLLDRIGRSDRPFFSLEVAVLGLIVSQPPVPTPSGRDPDRSVGTASFQPQAETSSPSSLRGSAGDRSNLATPRRISTSTGGKTPEVEEARSAGKTSGVEGSAAGGERARSGVKEPAAKAEESAPQPHASPLRQGSAGQARLTPHASASALTRIQSAWTSLPLKLADVNGSLPYLLEGGRPQRIVDGVLTIGFRYKLHAEKVRQPKVLDAIAHAVSEVAGTPLRVATTVISASEFATLDAAVHPKTGDAVTDAALEVFGGRVVE